MSATGLIHKQHAFISSFFSSASNQHDESTIVGDIAAPYIRSIQLHAYSAIVHVSSQISRLVNSADGLSTALRVAIMANVVKEEIFKTKTAFSSVYEQFDAYRTIVDISRIFAAPDYFLGEDLEHDIQQRRWYGIISSISGIASAVFTFTSFLCTSVLTPYVASSIKDVKKSAFFNQMSAVSATTATVFAMGAVCFGTIENIRDIARRRDNITYSLFCAGANTADLLCITFDVVPGLVPPAGVAICGLVAASCGIGSFFLNPQA